MDNSTDEKEDRDVNKRSTYNSGSGSGGSIGSNTNPNTGPPTPLTGNLSRVTTRSNGTAPPSVRMPRVTNRANTASQDRGPIKPASPRPTVPKPFVRPNEGPTRTELQSVVDSVQEQILSNDTDTTDTHSEPLIKREDIIPQPRRCHSPRDNTSIEVYGIALDKSTIMPISIDVGPVINTDYDSSVVTDDTIITPALPVSHVSVPNLTETDTRTTYTIPNRRIAPSSYSQIPKSRDFRGFCEDHQTPVQSEQRVYPVQVEQRTIPQQEQRSYPQPEQRTYPAQPSYAPPSSQQDYNTSMMNTSQPTLSHQEQRAYPQSEQRTYSQQTSYVAPYNTSMTAPQPTMFQQLAPSFSHNEEAETEQYDYTEYDDVEDDYQGEEFYTPPAEIQYKPAPVRYNDVQPIQYNVSETAKVLQTGEQSAEDGTQYKVFGIDLGPINMPKYNEMSLTQQSHYRGWFNIQYEKIRGTYPGYHIPDLNTAPLEELHAQYDMFLRHTHITRDVDKYKIYLVLMWLAIQLVCNKLQLNVGEYTQIQMASMHKYEGLLFELGEANYKAVVTESGGQVKSRWSPEWNIIFVALINCIGLILINMISQYVGNDAARSISDQLMSYLSSDIVPARGGGNIAPGQMQEPSQPFPQPEQAAGGGMGFGGFDLNSINLPGLLSNLGGIFVNQQKPANNPVSSTPMNTNINNNQRFQPAYDE